ncbi:MAG: sigma-54 dependent transcriptional regulator [Candidatus Latescibacterota bacterium]
MKKILLAEDEEIMRITLKDGLSNEGYQVIAASDGREALEKFRQDDFDLLITDLRMPKLDGIELLKEVKCLSPEIPVIIITAYGTIETAVQAVKLGAYDYLTKPLLIDELLMMMEKIFQFQNLQRENLLLRQTLEERYQLDNLIGKDKKMQEIYRRIQSVAEGNSTVLIYGETGTGKGMVSQAIHRNSPRKNKPFVEVSCAALPESLLESELFGYERGAFTGAVRRKEGRFEWADGGTLFLDEVDDMKPEVQVKLLRVLEYGEFERVGGTHTISVDVRVIAASKTNLEQAVFFREDLYYRLHVVPVHIPPLRERKCDIPLLVNHFVKLYSDKAGKIVSGVSAEALTLMMEYNWPGNVRQLENSIEGAVALIRDGEICPEDLPAAVRGEGNAMQPLDSQCLKHVKDVVKEAEIEHIRKVLVATEGRKDKAANILGISRKTLWEKIRMYGLHVTNM